MKPKYFAHSRTSLKTNKPARPSFRRGCLLAVGAITMVGSHSALAAPFVWDGGDATLNNWSSANNWSPNGAPPTASGANDFTFTDASLRASPNLEGNYSILSLTFGASGGAFSFTGSGSTQTLTIGAGGILNSSGSAQNFATSLENVNLGTSQTWNAGSAVGGSMTFASTVGLGTFALTIDGANNTTINGVVSGTGATGITKNGLGTLTLSGANTYDGNTILNVGTLRATTSATALGDTGTLTLAGGILELAHTAGLSFNRNTTVTGNSAITADRTTSSATSITHTLGTLSIGAQTLTVQRGSNVTGAGIGGITFGATTLTGAATFDVGSNALLTFSTTLNNGGNLLKVQGAGDTTITGIVSGVGGLTKDGAGILTLGGANTYGGDTTISSGTIKLGVAGGIPSGASKGNVVLNGTLDLNDLTAVSINGLSGSGTVDRSVAATAGNTTLTIGNNNAGGSFSGVIKNSGGTLSLTKTGTGTLTLSGSSANTYTGTTSVNDGRLELNKSGVPALTGTTLAIGDATGTVGSAELRLLQASQIPTATAVSINSDGLFALNGNNQTIGTLSMTAGAVTTGAGTLTLGGTVTGIANAASATISGNLALGATRTFTIADGTAATDMDISAAISGSTFGLTKGDTGTLALSGANSYTGTTTAGGGVLLLNNATALPGGIDTTVGAGESALTINGGVVGLGNGDFSRALANGAGQVQWTVVASGGFAVPGADRSVNIGGGTALTWNGTASFLTTGSLILGAADADATLDFKNSINLNVGTRVVQIEDGSVDVDAKLSGILSGTGASALTKNGTGTLVLSGANTYDGNTIVSAGAVRLQHNTALGSTTGTSSVTSGAALELDGSLGALTIGAEALTLNGTGISSGGALRNVVGNNSYAGVITLGSASRINSDADTLVIDSAGNITGTFALTVGGSGNVTISDSINTTTGTLTKDGSGTLTLAVASGYTGITSISAGTVKVQNGTSLGTTAAGTTVASDAAIQIVGSGLNIAEAITSLAGDGGGNGALRNLANNNTWSGAVTVADVGARINSDGGILTISGAIGEANSSLKNLTIGGSGDVTISNTITGGGDLSLVKDGNGILTLSGSSANTEVSTTVNAGALVLNKSSGDAVGGTLTIGDGTGTDTVRLDASNQIATVAVTIISSGVLNLNTFSDTVGALSVSGGSVISGGGSLTISTLAMTAGSVATGAGSLNLGGAVTGNAAATSATISGNLSLGANRTFTIADGAAVSDMDISAVISGATFGLTKAGAGTLTLSGANTYSGTTSVTVGKLVVDVSLGGTAVTVSGGASLGGTGTIGTATAGSVTVAAGNSAVTRGSIDLVNGSIGTLTLAARTATGTVLTMGGTSGNTSILNFEVGATADKIVLGSNARASVGAGGFQVNLTGLGSLDGVTRKLIDAPSGLASGSFATNTLNSTSGNFSGFTLALTSTATDLSLTQTANAVATAAFWKGTNDGVWNSFTGGNNNISNFASVVGGTNATGKVGATTDVNFNATTTANFANTTLGENFTIKSLTFGSNATSSVGIGGSNTLTITPGSSTTGVTVAVGSGNHTISSKVALGADQTWTVTDSGQTLTASNEISGGFALTKAGAGTLTLSGANTYSGLTKVSAGTLAYGASDALSAGNVTVDGATAILAMAAFNDSVGAVTLANGGTISGSGTLTGTSYALQGGTVGANLGAGTVTVSTGTTTLNGISGSLAVNVNTGTLALGANDRLANGAAVAVAGGTLNIASFNDTVGAVSLSSGNINGTGGALTGSSYSLTNTGSVSAILAGAGALTKTGSGTATLSGNNTYTGITSINDGALVINGNQSTANGAVTVASIAKLFGTGTIGGATVVHGTQSSGASSGAVGTQNFSSSLTYNSGSIFEWDINVSGLSETHDKVVAGSLTGSGAVFKIGLVGSGDTYASAFWDTNRNWSATDLFGVNTNLATIFSSATTTTNFNQSPLEGYFSFTNNGGTGNQLTWTAVPEPTSALAGILLAAGLLRRRRVAP